MKYIFVKESPECKVLSWLPEIAAATGIIYVLLVCLIKRSFFYDGSWLGASLIGYLGAFLLTSYGLKTQGMGFARVIFGFTAMAVSIYLYEMVYRYSGVAAWRYIFNDIFHPNLFPRRTHFPIIGLGMVVLSIFTGYKYMSLNKWFWILLSISIISHGFWIIIGFPMWDAADTYPTRGQMPIIDLGIRSEEAVTMVSAICNTFSKISICITLPALFLGKIHSPDKTKNPGRLNPPR